MDDNQFIALSILMFSFIIPIFIFWIVDKRKCQGCGKVYRDYSGRSFCPKCWKDGRAEIGV